MSHESGDWEKIDRWSLKRRSRHDSVTKHPEKMKIGMGLVQAMEGRPRLRPGGYAGLAASSRPHSRIYFGHAEAPHPTSGVRDRHSPPQISRNNLTALF